MQSYFQLLFYFYILTLRNLQCTKPCGKKNKNVAFSYRTMSFTALNYFFVLIRLETENAQSPNYIRDILFDIYLCRNFIAIFFSKKIEK